jgi:hypothetical protein
MRCESFRSGRLQAGALGFLAAFVALALILRPETQRGYQLRAKEVTHLAT